jgi:hypothetical protein
LAFPSRRRIIGLRELARKHCNCGLDTYLKTIDWNTFTVKPGLVMKGWCVWLVVSVLRLLKMIRYWNLTVCIITNSNSGLARYLHLNVSNNPKRNSWTSVTLLQEEFDALVKKHWIPDK